MSLREKITKGRIDQPWREMMVGTEGVGKTTYAATCPAPLFLACEDGTGQLDVARVAVETYSDVTDAIADLTRDAQGFQTIVLDTVDALEGLIVDHLCRAKGWGNIEDAGYGKGYVAVAQEWRTLLAQVEAMQRAARVNVLSLGHVHVKKYSPPDSEPYDRFDLKLAEKSAALLREWHEAVFFARHEIVVSQVKGESKRRGYSTGDRVIHTVETAAYRAKNRYGLPETMRLTDSTYAVIESYRKKNHRAELEVMLSGADEEKASKARAWFEGQANKARALEIIKQRLSQGDSGKAA